MSSEDPKQADSEPRSSKRADPSVGDADVLKQPQAPTATLNESEIDAAVGVLGQPPQLAGSSPASARVFPPSDMAAPLITASTVEKSKREAGASASGDVAGDSEDVTKYFDRGALTSRTPNSSDGTADSSTAPEPPPPNASTALEEPTLFFKRPKTDLAPPAPGSKRLGPRPLPPTNAPPSRASGGPMFGEDRASSISLASGIASFTSADGSSGVESQPDRSSSQPPSTKSALPRPLPPRPDVARPAAAGTVPARNASIANLGTAAPSSRSGAESSANPSQHQPALPTDHVKTEPAKSGEESADAEPLSERSNDAPGGEAEVPAQGQTAVTAFSIAPRPGSAGYDDEAWLDPITVRGAQRLVSAAASCTVVGLALAPVEAIYARRAALDATSIWQLTLACAGLLVPLCLATGAIVALLSILLHPDAAPSLGQLRQKLRPADIRRQARLAVILAVSPVAGAIWILAVARASLPLLGSSAAPPAVGTLLAAVAVGLGLLAAVPVLALARYAGVRLRQSPPDPVRWGAIGLCLGLVLILVTVATGPTSGAGSSLAILGVFKRPELDLRACCLLLLIALAGYLVPGRIGWLQPKWLLLLAMLPLGLTYRAASRGLDVRKVALAVERGAPLSRSVLSVARRLTDRDHDGFSRFFGGGDCDDRDRNRNPGQEDIPQNGIDEDCSGTDSVAPTARNLIATPSEELRARRADIPGDLNLILFIVDTLRADTLRHSKHVTPRFDELAAQSAVIEQAYSPASYTGKSVGPILIGKHSSETNRDFGHFSAFSKRDTFVQQRLQRAGIRTVSVQGYWYFYQPLYGFDRGFDVVDSNASGGSGYVEGDRSSTGEKLTDRILAQLENPENTNGRFFLWSQYTDPHAEYVPHAGFDFGNDSLGRYLGEVAFVDHQIGRIIDFVRSKPWGARTAIVITSDHGESFGEHGMIRHGFELWEPLIRVPLIVSVPGVKAVQIGARRTLVDLVPTILDLMQLEPATDLGTDFTSGHSLLPEILGIKGADAPRPLLVDMAQGPFTNERQAYIDGDLKLLTAQGRPLGLFDLAKDAEERHDLLDEAATRERVVSNYRAYKKTMRIVEVRGK